MDKWAILLDGESYILGLQYFSPTQTVPAEYIQISESVYKETLAYLQPWSKFVAGKIFNGAAEQAAYELKTQIADLRQKMMDIQQEITLNTFLSESTTLLESQLADTKDEYDALITPP